MIGCQGQLHSISNTALLPLFWGVRIFKFALTIGKSMIYVLVEIVPEQTHAKAGN